MKTTLSTQYSAEKEQLIRNFIDGMSTKSAIATLRILTKHINEELLKSEGSARFHYVEMALIVEDYLNYFENGGEA